MAAALNHQDQNGERREQNQGNTFPKKLLFISPSEPVHFYN